MQYAPAEAVATFLKEPRLEARLLIPAFVRYQHSVNVDATRPDVRHMRL